MVRQRLTVKEFANYKQDLIVSVSLQVSAPLGQYDDTKLLNLGNNRWSFRPELGISKTWGPWTLEVAPSVTFFTVNSDFFNGNQLEQAPLYWVRGQSHSTISIRGSGFHWTTSISKAHAPRSMAAKATTEQENVGGGMTACSVPIVLARTSIKLNLSTGIYARTGSQFSNVGIALAISMGWPSAIEYAHKSSQMSL